MAVRRIPTLCAAVAVALIAAAATTAAAGSPARGTGWSRADLRPVTQPAPVAGRLVFYAVRHGTLTVVALDPATGRTVWTAKASPSANTPGVAPVLDVVGDSVISLEGTDLDQLVARDARTGKRRWRSGLGTFTTWPVVCNRKPVEICVTGYEAIRGNRIRYLRFDGVTGKLQGVTPFSPVGDGREVGDELFDAGTRSPELLAAIEHRKLVWTRPLAQIFPLHGVSTDWGWNFDRLEKAGIFIGSVPGPPVARSATKVTLDVSREMTAAFRIRDGAVVWRRPGTAYVCTLLPCPGAPQTGYSAPIDNPGIGVGVRLRARGTVTESMLDLQHPVGSPDIAVTVEGFDPGTGKTLWTFAAGRALGLVTFIHLPTLLGPNAIALRDAKGRFVRVDLRTGPGRQVGKGQTGWCRSPIIYALTSGATPLQYVGQFGAFHCDLEQRRLPVPARVPAFLAAIGARSGGLIAWSDTDGVHAARAAGP